MKEFSLVCRLYVPLWNESQGDAAYLGVEAILAELHKVLAKDVSQFKEKLSTWIAQIREEIEQTASAASSPENVTQPLWEKSLIIGVGKLYENIARRLERIEGLLAASDTNLEQALKPYELEVYDQPCGADSTRQAKRYAYRELFLDTEEALGNVYTGQYIANFAELRVTIKKMEPNFIDLDKRGQEEVAAVLGFGVG